ncbi:MAG: sigma-54-dependent Fis family transcriptional regulator, partial [Calditrichaeota bacterium]
HLGDLKRLKKLPNLYVYTRRDIEQVIQANRAEQQKAAEEIEAWIAEEVAAFERWQTGESPFRFLDLIGSTPRMQRIFELISRIARTDTTVLIEGESGTGKELVARAIHQLSHRSEKPFVTVNCGAIPENLLESELFGHVRGAFTGAVTPKQGLFEVANQGTVFLDEIGELPVHLQVKLLRVLQDGEIKRVGSNETIRVDVRVLAATNRDLQEMVQQGAFRSDLYYRLNVIQLTLPPLRERVADIPLLAHHFLKKFAARFHKDVVEISPEALEALQRYPWPGNVRELENALERATALAVGKAVTLYDLPPALQKPASAPPPVALPPDGHPPLTLKELEKQYILEILKACNWNYEKACKQLDIGRTTLWRKLKEYRIDVERGEKER